MKLLNRYLQENEKNVQNKNKNNGQNQHHANYKQGKTPFLAYLRVRPLFLPEQMKNPQPSIEVLDRESVIFKHEHQQGLKSLTKDKLYRCTRTVPPGGKTNSLLQLGILDLVNDSFHGLNQAAFVIGGKDSGKTHTFIGNVADPGLSFTIASTIFQSKLKSFDQSRVYVSFFSFQNNFKDLLSYTGECLEHRTTHNGSYIPGLSQVECPDMLSYLTLYKTALIVNGKRDINRDFSQAFTLFNPQPDKEIFIVKFTIINTFEENSENGSIFKHASSDLFLIDTESYEPLDKIDSKGVNNAMLSFNNCMRTIYEINMGMREDHFVHYEQSPFTSYFKEYLGGKAQTFIIGTVSPYSGHLEYSMRTVREVQWAYKSKSSGVKDQELMIGKIALAHEVSYLKIMHNDSVLINQEITMFLKRKNLLEEEEKQKYVQFLGRIFKKFYYINRICNEKIKRIFELRDQVDELNNSIIEQEKSVMKEQLRSPDIKEFFLVKIVPLMYNLVYSKISKAQQNLQKKLKLLKSECLIICQIKKDLKDFIDLYIRKNSLIKTNHQEAIFSFTKALIDHMNWTQFNCFKSFNYPDKEKLKENKIKVEKTVESNFKRIFASLNVNDYDKYEDKAFAYVGIRLSDIDQKQNKARMSQFKQNPSKVPSHNTLEKNSSTSIRHGEENQEESRSLHGIQKQLSSIFDLPSTLAVIKGKSGKSKQLQMMKSISRKNTKKVQSSEYSLGDTNSENDDQNDSLDNLEEEDEQDDDDYDDDDDDDEEEEEYEILNQDNSAYRKRKYKEVRRKVSHKMTSLCFKDQQDNNHSNHHKQNSQNNHHSNLYNDNDDEDDDHNLIYIPKSKKRHHQKQLEQSNNQHIIPRLNPPQVSIQANRSEIKINRKINMGGNSSPKNNRLMQSHSGHLSQPQSQQQSQYIYLPNLKNIQPYQNSFPTSESTNSHRNINMSSQLMDTKQTTDHIMINGYNKNRQDTIIEKQKQQLLQQQSLENDEQMDTITFGIPSKSKHQKNSKAQDQNQNKNEEEQDQYQNDSSSQEDDYNHNNQQLQTEEDNYEQNSLLNAINTERMQLNTTELNSDTINSQRSNLPMIAQSQSQKQSMMLNNNNNNINKQHSQSMFMEKDILTLNSDILYYQDLSLKSKFNQKLTVHVNLFKQDLSNYKLPISINKIFTHKQSSVSRLQTQKAQLLFKQSQDLQQSQSTKSVVQEFNLNNNNNSNSNNSSLPKIPPKNSIMNRQAQIAISKIQQYYNDQNNNNNNILGQNNYTKSLSTQQNNNKSIYDDGLQALVMNSGSSAKRYATVDQFFDKIDDAPLLQSKAMPMKEKIFIKRIYYALRKKNHLVYKPNNIQKILVDNHNDDQKFDGNHEEVS